MELIYVHVEFPVALQDDDGSWTRIEGTGGGVFFPVTASLYRRNAWMGLFHRFLSRRFRFGRWVLVDEVWRKANETARGVRLPESQTAIVASGCGCHGKKSAV